MRSMEVRRFGLWAPDNGYLALNAYNRAFTTKYAGHRHLVTDRTDTFLLIFFFI